MRSLSLFQKWAAGEISSCALTSSVVPKTGDQLQSKQMQPQHLIFLILYFNTRFFIVFLRNTLLLFFASHYSNQLP